MYVAVGKRVRIIRLERKMTQQVLADKAGISLSFLGHIERGTRKMSLETFLNVVNALECSADDLLNTGRYGKLNLRVTLSNLADLMEQGALEEEDE